MSENQRQPILSEHERKVYDDAVAAGISSEDLDDFLSSRSTEELPLYEYVGVVSRTCATHQELLQMLGIVAGFRVRDQFRVWIAYCDARGVGDVTHQEAIEFAYRTDLISWRYLEVRARGVSREVALELFVQGFDAREYGQVDSWAKSFTGTAPGHQDIVEVLGGAGDYTRTQRDGSTTVTTRSQPGMLYGRLLGTGATHMQALEVLVAVRFDGVDIEDYYTYRGFTGQPVLEPGGWRMEPGGPHQWAPLGHDAALRTC